MVVLRGVARPELPAGKMTDNLAGAAPKERELG
jgi:hypothetical protein